MFEEVELGVKGARRAHAPASKRRDCDFIHAHQDAADGKGDDDKRSVLHDGIDTCTALVAPVSGIPRPLGSSPHPQQGPHPACTKEGDMPERWSVHGEMADTVNYGLRRRYWDER